MRTAKVTGRDRSEALLTSGIPNLKLDLCSIDIYVFNLEIDPNSGDKSGTERVVCVTEKETGLSYSGIANHQQFDLDIVRGTSGTHGVCAGCICEDVIGRPKLQLARELR